MSAFRGRNVSPINSRWPYRTRGPGSVGSLGKRIGNNGAATRELGGGLGGSATAGSASGSGSARLPAVGKTRTVASAESFGRLTNTGLGAGATGRIRGAAIGGSAETFSCRGGAAVRITRGPVGFGQ